MEPSVAGEIERLDDRIGYVESQAEKRDESTKRRFEEIGEHLAESRAERRELVVAITGLRVDVASILGAVKYRSKALGIYLAIAGIVFSAVLAWGLWSARAFVTEIVREEIRQGAKP